MGIVLFGARVQADALFMRGVSCGAERNVIHLSPVVPFRRHHNHPNVILPFGLCSAMKAVIRRAGGVECLESWLLREKSCPLASGNWHSENMTQQCDTRRAQSALVLALAITSCVIRLTERPERRHG